MGKRDLRLDIINAVYATCTQMGLEKTTTKKISMAAKTSENVIYRYFPGKVELFEIAFFEINSEIDLTMQENFFKTMPIDKAATSEEISLLLWNSYLDYWITHPQKALFYDQYIHSAYINNEVWAKQSQSFVFFTKLLKKLKNDISNNNEETESFVFLIMMIINSAIMLATNSIKTNQPIPENAKSIIYRFIKTIFNN